jgi:hypothetical protein
VTAEAELVQRLRNENKLNPSINFSNMLKTHAISRWVPTKDSIHFPNIGARENPGKADGSEKEQNLWKTGTQYFMEIFLANSIRNGKIKLCETSESSSAFSEQPVTLIPSSTYSKVSFSSRKPDFIHMEDGMTGALSIAFFLEVKGRYSDGDFKDSDIGQVIDMNIDLMKAQPYRTHAVCALTDGYRFQFFLTNRVEKDSFLHDESQVFVGELAWQVTVWKHVMFACKY